MIESAKMSMKGWAASTPLCPKKNHIQKKTGMDANNASKSNKATIFVFDNHLRIVCR